MSRMNVDPWLLSPVVNATTLKTIKHSVEMRSLSLSAMPTWRVAEQFPAALGALDLVIIDEASQSDVTELPALLRGRKILVVGDDRQVSPTAPFVTQAKIAQLLHHYLGELPFKNLLEPGESIYNLMRAVFPNERLMLKEHFRCVEPIIRFSMQFYPEKIMPISSICHPARGELLV